MWTREVSVKEEEEEWMVRQQSNGSFGQVFGVIYCFLNSFNIVSC